MLRDVYTLSEGKKLKFENYELERINWLRKINPALQKKHTDSRVNLVTLLGKYGASIDARSKGMGNAPNSIVLMVSSRQDTMHKSTSDAINENPMTGYGGSISNANVAMALDSFKKYESDENVYILTEIDSSWLVYKLDSLLRQFENKFSEANFTDSINIQNELALSQPAREVVNDEEGSLRRGEKIDVLGTGGPDAFHTGTKKGALFNTHQTFNGIFLHNANLYISIVNRKPGTIGMNPGVLVTQSGAQGNQGTFYEEYFITIPAKSDSVKFPSTLEFAGLDTMIVQGLAHNKSKQEELSNLYGSYNLDFIDNLSIEAFNKNNSSVSILGFDISRKWFPIAMFIILLTIYCMLYKTIYKASEFSLKIVSEYTSEDTLDFLIDNKLIRFIIWVIIPVFLLFFVLYSTLIQYSIVIYMGLLLVGVLCVLLGWLSYRKSLKL
jgi:hypothetical protein